MGDAVTLVVASFAPARRSIDCAVPNMASVVEPQDGEAVVAEAAGAVAPADQEGGRQEGRGEEGGGVAGQEGGSVAGQEGRPAARREEGCSAIRQEGGDGVEGTGHGCARAAGQGTDRQEGHRRLQPSARRQRSRTASRRTSRAPRRGRLAGGAGAPAWPEDPGGRTRSSRPSRPPQAEPIAAASTRRRRRFASGEPAATPQSGREEGGRRVIRLATWNINSLKVRMPRVEQWLAEVEPDIVCLQETKVADDAFPALTFASMGYESAHHGQGQWNGVAVLSKVGLDDVVANFAARHRPRRRRQDHHRHLRRHPRVERVRAERPVARPRALRVQARLARSARFARHVGLGDRRCGCGRRRLQHRSRRPRRLRPHQVRRRHARQRARAGAVARARRLRPGRRVPAPLRRWRRVLVVGLPRRRLPRRSRHADRPDPRHRTGRRTRRVVCDRPQRRARASSPAITPPCWSTCATDRRPALGRCPGTGGWP